MNRFAFALALGLAACSKNAEPTPTAAPATSATAAAAPSAPAAAPSAAGSTSPDAIAAVGMLPDAGLSAREQSDLASVLSSLDAPCPSVPVSLATCIAQKRVCSDCEAAARYLAIGIRNGWPGQYLGMAYASRFDPEQKKDLPIDGSPTKGPATAPITIVEFGSYLCPHCAAEAPKLDALLAAHPKDVRLVFKPVWMPENPTSVQMTQAAFAAGQQGKFWEMHALVFAEQAKAPAIDLEGDARSISLDMARFKADAGSPTVQSQMKRDRALAAAIGIDNLPTLYINGHPMVPFEKLEQRIAFELSLTSK